MATNKKNKRQKQTYSQGPESLPTRKRKPAPPANPPDSRKPKNKKGRGRRNNIIYYIILLILLIGTSVVLSLTVLFKIEDIRVVGDNYYPAEDIINSTGILLEENLFLTSTKGLSEKLAVDFPYIEDAVIKKSLPPAIEIHLTPSKVAAALELSEGEYALISDSGKVLERGLVLLPADVILVKGTSIKEKLAGDYLGKYEPIATSADDEKPVSEYKAEQNQLLKEQADYEINNILAVITYFNEAVASTEFAGVTNLDITDPYNMTVMYENRILIELGTEIRLEYKFRFVKGLIDKYINPKAHGTIHAENLDEQDPRINFLPASGDSFDKDGVPFSDDISITDPIDPDTGETYTAKSGGTAAADPIDPAAELSPDFKEQ